MTKKRLNSKSMPSRKGIAMIELIFAIVIIGITLMSIPNLIHQASRSGYTTLQQEAIAAAASDLSLILAREWDEAGTNDSLGSPILDTASPTVSLSSRPGGRSRLYATSTGGTHLSASAIGHDSNDFDDIDDAAGKTGTVTLIDGDQDLIDINISIDTNVTYIADAPTSGDWNSSTNITFYDTSTNPFITSAGTTNIKHVTITLTSTSDIAELADKEITFSAFSTNIGSYKLERREIP